jgi:hypothetical protein
MSLSPLCACAGLRAGAGVISAGPTPGRTAVTFRGETITLQIGYVIRSA